jgi:ATP phosphoribosyltransferase
MSDTLRVAMPKGRIFEKAVELLRSAGYPMPQELDESRKLIIPVPEAGMEFILAKPVDVPIYVEYGVTDIGIVGKDVLLEDERDVYELLDLGIGKCRMSVIGLPDWKPTVQEKVATKYPRIAAQYFREKGQQVEVIKLNGSIELAPLIGLADRIVDLIETGRTMKENGLVELEEIVPITSRLIANRVSYRMKGEAIDDLVNKLERLMVKGGVV